MNIAITIYDNDFQMPMRVFLEAMVFRKPSTKEEIVELFNTSIGMLSYISSPHSDGVCVPYVELKVEDVWLGDEVNGEFLFDKDWNGELVYLDVNNNYVVNSL